jgi:hypothetical protein
MRRVFIVSRDSLTLANYLRAWFGTDVDVVIDRRHAERRHPGTYAGSERRRGDRRSRPRIDEEVRLTAFALVDLPN